MASVWVHLVLELEQGHPVNGVIYAEPPPDFIPTRVADSDFGPFDDLWDCALWLHQALRSLRQRGIV